MTVHAPYADDLILGIPLQAAPSITIDSGVAATYQAITGDALRLPLSQPDSLAVAGGDRRLANPALVLQIAIGQSTVATARVIANLFYRSVALRRQVRLGDTLSTQVTPTALELTKSEVAPRRAKVLLRIQTTDDRGERVADFERLALLPCRDAETVMEGGQIGAADQNTPLTEYLPFIPEWNFQKFPTENRGAAGVLADPLSDTVSNALELVRLTQNLAAAHRDPARGIGGRRLVYGGHAIGMAQASLARMVPGLMTVLGWRSCSHTAPVFEGDVLDFEHEVTDRHVVGGGVELFGLKVTVRARRHDSHSSRAERTEVLDWRPVALVKTANNIEIGETK
ncbi:hypothetical protein AU252_01055 [Pseudarthrobacter sulfonivorans]|uniref:Acyl dehydratase n=1 Tax=Pseudarthrobacter sulfonivorans TaxID=121292 RepID=A0A0U2X7D4_9MICC|nr:hypothetical protein [Pseudarthrobacter sulfonivorans]ALV39922.1 hypothetical protein AU252_01055 [Pseudarthrobacter sulfonivorans]